jgi:EmrB/QacA subfamily drug resistance transporter
MAIVDAGKSRMMMSKQRWTLALSSVGSFMVVLDLLVVSTALSTIRHALGASIEELEWTVNAYTLSFAVLLMTGAALGDRFGRRRMFVAGLGLFAVASAACALSPGIGWLIAARAVQGGGAALVMPLALTLLSAAFPPEQRGRALGIYGSVTGLASLTGPVVGGAVTQGLAWQWIFWLNVPIGLVAIPLVLSRIDESFGPRTALDIGGLVLVTGAALGMVSGLVRGNSAGWGSFEVVVALVAGIGLAVAFVIWEMRTRAPMVPMRLFRSGAFSAGNAAIFCLNASLTGAVFFLAQFLQTAQGQSPLDAGLRLLPFSAVPFVLAPITGALVNRIGVRALILGGLLLQAVGMAWIALVAAPGLAYPALIAPMVIIGCGYSLAIPANSVAVVSSVTASEIGKASGTFTMLRQLGGTFGVAILAAVFARVGSFASPQAFSDGFAPAMSVAAALALAGAVVALAIPGRRTATEASPMPHELVPQVAGAGARGN